MPKRHKTAARARAAYSIALLIGESGADVRVTHDGAGVRRTCILRLTAAMSDTGYGHSQRVFSLAAA